jgi:hypothetical protein
MKWLIISHREGFASSAIHLLQEAGQEVVVENHTVVFHIGPAAKKGVYEGTNIVVIDNDSIIRTMRGVIVHAIRKAMIENIPYSKTYLFRSSWVPPEVVNLFRARSKKLGKETCRIINSLDKKTIEMIIADYDD